MLVDANKVLRSWPEEMWALAQSEFAFHVGGSHFFGCAREDSDIDFITEESQAVVDWLVSNGFSRMGGTEAEYSVPETQTRGVYQKGKVQVQVVYNIKATLIARDVLAKHFADEHLKADGPTRREVWSKIIRTIDLVEVNFAFGVSEPFSVL